MPLVQISKDPSPKELRWFGVGFVSFVVFLGWVLVRREGVTAGYGVWLLGAVISGLYFTVPSWGRWFYRIFVTAVYPVGWTVSLLLLGLTYFGVFSLLGLTLKLFRYDPLTLRGVTTRKNGTGDTSYWVERKTVRSPGRYFRQF